MPQLELKIPPPLVAVMTAGAMYGVASLLPVLALSPSVRAVAALALAVVGASFDVAGLVAFRRAKTTVNPMAPHQSSSVVSTGVYRFTRNPMYLGLVFLLLAWAVYLSSAWALLGVPVFMAYITRFQIKPEENVLAARFGKSYADYRARVRRWL
ncbi:MAG: isoprenylcysteine carboxylmethyltransferase family protein [Polaromonas sp.]